MPWNSLSSAEKHSQCGENAPNTADAMLDATNAWFHVFNHVHWLILDLGADADIRKFRFKDFGTNTPDDVDIYISTSLGTGGDDSTWGTAVATGVNMSSFDELVFTEVDTIDAVGRYIYFHINSTTSGIDLLSWGTNGTKIIEYWTGVVPKRYTTIIPLHNQQFTATSETFLPTDGSQGMIQWDGSKYNNIVSAFLIGTGFRTGSVGGDPTPMWRMQLYDRTNTAEVGVVQGNGTAVETSISGDISSNLPAGVATLDVRFAHNDSTNATLYNFHLIIVQETEETGNKTRIYIPLASKTTRPSTSYQTFGAIGVAGKTEKHIKFLTNDYGDTISNAIFTATMRTSVAGITIFTKLDDIGEGGSLWELSTAATIPTLLTSSDISSSLVDNTTYTPWTKTAGGRAGANDIIYNAYLIIDITDPTKLLTVYDVANIGLNTTTAGWAEDTSQMVKYLTGTTFYSTDVTETLTHSSVINHRDSTGMSSSLYDDGVRDTNADVTTASETRTLVESSEITPANDSDISLGYNLATDGDFRQGTVWDSKIMVRLTDLGVAPEIVRRIFII